MQRNTKLLNFTKPGNPGTKFKSPFEKMLKALTLPKTVKEELNIQDENIGDNFIVSNQPTVKSLPDEAVSQTALSDEEELALTKALLSEGRYHLIPSFFKTLIYLKKMKKEFSVVFRNFNAQDLTHAVAEFNQFCKGEHPCYSGRSGTALVKFDGSKGTREMRFKEKHQRGHYFKEGDKLQQVRLVTGTPKRAPKGENVDEFYQGPVEEGSVANHKEGIDQYVAIIETLKKRATMSILDDKNAWVKSGNKKAGGKVLMVDQADYGTQHIFFDDVANNDVTSQVDVIDAVTGLPIQYSKFINKYVVKVESHRAVMEADYFIKAIEHAEH